MSEEAIDLKDKIADLQSRVLELQHNLPDTPLQKDLQRLQRELLELWKRPPEPVPRGGRRPRLRVVQPTATALPPMSAGEATIWKLFADFHQALLQYSGGGTYLPREEWIGLANTAAEMTTGAQALGGPMMGVTDGSDAVPGQIGEYLYQELNFTGRTVLGESNDQGSYNQIGTLNLTPGDWTVGAMCAMQQLQYPTSYVTANFVGPNIGYQWFIRGVSSQDLSPHFTAMRASSASPMVAQLFLEVVTAGAPGPTTFPGYSQIWARRVR